MSTEHLARVASIFDEWAQTGRAEGMERGHGPSGRIAFEALAPGDGESYLDIGCGNGYSLEWAAKCGAKVTGIDLSSGMIERARTRLEAYAPTLHRDSFPTAKLNPGDFDVIYSMEVFYYLPSLQEGLNAAHELLRAGGRFACVVDYYLENPESHSWPEDTGVAMTLWSEAEWRDGFKAAGFTSIEQKRLRSTDPTDPAWKRELGSLMTIGRLT
jgi:SAM-dependent methyltransferase